MQTTFAATSSSPKRAISINSFGRSIPSSIPKKPFRASTPIWDWHGLRRWGVSETALPLNNIVQFGEHYKWLIVLVLGLCVLEATLIDILLRERRRRRLAQEKLEERLRF